MDLGDFLKSINIDKNNVMADEFDGPTAEKDYNPFIINRCMSAYPDTILLAQEMNMRAGLDKRLQYEYYLKAVRARKRFSPWLRAEKIEDLDAVKEYFGYSNVKAKEALRVLTEDQLSYIKGKLFKGGLTKTKRGK